MPVSSIERHTQAKYHRQGPESVLLHAITVLSDSLHMFSAPSQSPHIFFRFYTHNLPNGNRLVKSNIYLLRIFFSYLLKFPDFRRYFSKISHLSAILFHALQILLQIFLVKLMAAFIVMMDQPILRSV